MDFRSICLYAAVLSALFGIAFVVAPGATGAMYGVVASDPGTLLVGRYFGAESLMFAAVVSGLRALTDPDAQRAAAKVIALATAVGLGVTLHGVLSGSMNSLGWSSVVIYGFFLLAWARIGFAAAPVMRRA